MRLEINRLGIAAPAVAPVPRAAGIDDYLHHGLFFALWRHRLEASCVRVELRAEPRADGAAHHCAIAGVIKRFGAFRVEGSAAEVHEAIDRTLHRLEMWLIAKVLDEKSAFYHDSALAA